MSDFDARSAHWNTVSKSRPFLGPTPLTMAEFGGYECEFVSGGSIPPNQLVCSLCIRLLRDPCLVDCCGAKYCQTCANDLQANGQPCNVCKEQFNNAGTGCKFATTSAGSRGEITLQLMHTRLYSKTYLTILCLMIYRFTAQEKVLMAVNGGGSYLIWLIMNALISQLNQPISWPR